MLGEIVGLENHYWHAEDVEWPNLGENEEFDIIHMFEVSSLIMFKTFFPQDWRCQKRPCQHIVGVITLMNGYRQMKGEARSWDALPLRSEERRKRSGKISWTPGVPAIGAANQETVCGSHKSALAQVWTNCLQISQATGRLNKKLANMEIMTFCFLNRLLGEM